MMRVTVVQKPTTLFPAYWAARNCYSFSMEFKDLSHEVMEKFLREKIIARGHLGILEHLLFTFNIEGISRACSHQLVRHRVASYAQQSQRYVKVQDDLEFVEPKSIRENPQLSDMFSAITNMIKQYYSTFIQDGVPEEDARYILPNATPTNIVMSMNARALIEASKKRLCTRAQDEIRELFAEIKTLVLNDPVTRLIGEQLGPSCLHAACPEGTLSCRK